MKWSFASVGLIMLGLFGIVIIMLFNDITVSNEQDYYTLKYATEAAMLEAVDVAYYRNTGEIKISQEKFVENFSRRFTETSTFGQGNYGIEFYQINETPPKVSLRIIDLTSGYNIYTYTSDVTATQASIVNELSAILDGSKVDADSNGYNLIVEKDIIDSMNHVVTNDGCEAKVLVGKDKNTGKDVYQCSYADSSIGYEDSSGKAVSEGNITFGVPHTVTHANMCVSGTLVYVGRLKSNTNKTAYKCTNDKGKEIYVDDRGNVLSASDIDTKYRQRNG